MRDKNRMTYVLMKEFDNNRIKVRKDLEEHIAWRTVPREIQHLFYTAYEHVNKLSDIIVNQLLESDEDFDYSSDEYLNFVLAEEQLYDFIYYTLDKRYGVRNCLPY